MILATFRAIAQLSDPAFFGAVLRSVAWSVVGFALLALGVSAGLHAWLAWAGSWSWAAGIAGFFATAMLSVWLFVPLSTAIASLFTDRIADAVERRHYHALPPATPADTWSQISDATSVGLRVFAMQALAALTTLIPPHVTGVFLSWVVASWAVGRGLFVPVAMRRMDRAHALLVYRSARTEVMMVGALITAAGLVPVLNLLAPILGVAVMVHVLHASAPSNAVAPRIAGGAPVV